MGSKAIYAFSGDPITRGHIDVIERARRVFDHVLVGIGVNPVKKYTFTLEEREMLARKALHRMTGVTVRSFDDLLVDFAYRNDIKTIIRGVRNTTDFAFEKMLNDVNQSQRLGVDTFLLVADQKLSHVSSDAVKELQRLQGKNILDYVPMVVKAALEVKVCKQYRIGITGEIGAGKSYVAEALGRRLFMLPEGEKVPVNNIDLDRIGHEILEGHNEPIDKIVREKIFEAFGTDVRSKNDYVDTRKLGNIIFADEGKLAVFNEIMREPMLLRIRQALINVEGLVVINSALITEAGICDLVNNHVVLVTAPEKLRRSRLRKRGYSQAEMKRRMSSQWSAQEKTAKIRDSMDHDGFGCLLFYNNDSDSPTPHLELTDLIHDIEKYTGMWGIEELS